MKAPDFLVIGAMKSGTTTLYEDLALHPGVALGEKESAGLHRHDPRTLGGRTAYLRQWAHAPAGAVLGEVATTYAMAPHHSGAPVRAAAVAPEARIVYIVREPVARIVSHHHHDLSGGTVTVGIDEAVHDDARFVDYSRYGTQLQLWRTHFPDDAIRIVRFEDYVADRRGEIDRLLAWLGISPLPDEADVANVYNASEGRQSARGLTRRIIHSDAYREALRPLVPKPLRSRVARAVLPTAPPRPSPPRPETVAWLVDQLREEVSTVRQFTAEAVTWDLDVVLSAARDVARNRT